MKLNLEIGDQRYLVQLPGNDISIPLVFNGPQPNVHNVPRAVSGAYQSGGWVGDTRRGGSCNFETHTLTPHCNGTHTECVGHITHERLHVRALLQEALVPATLVSVQPIPMGETHDHYDPALNPADFVIDRATLRAALQRTPAAFHEAILIRTLPNNPNKASRDYMLEAPAFFTMEAMKYLVGLGMRHLLTDLPSVDRMFDDGRLSAHHIFWHMTAGGHDLSQAAPQGNTITEMIFVPDTLPDGQYLLNLQIAPFMADAAPSRPFLFTLDPL